MAWVIDPSHSQVQFTVRHMMISNVRGRFEEFEGTIEFNEEDPTKSTLDVRIKADSINTRDEKRDAHLRSPDFLNAEQYPYITFRGTRFDVIDRTHGRITGDLTVRDVTRPVTLDVEYNGMAKAPWGSVSAGFSAETKINRKDWGLVWNVALETGGMLVGDEIKVNVEVEIVKVVEEAAEAVAAV
jgi:polyisoprenoid-binding protein YceI